MTTLPKPKDITDMTNTRDLAVLEPDVADRRQSEGAGGNVPGVTTEAERTARIHAQERLAVESGWVELDDDLEHDRVAMEDFARVDTTGGVP